MRPQLCFSPHTAASLSHVRTVVQWLTKIRDIKGIVHWIISISKFSTSHYFFFFFIGLFCICSHEIQLISSRASESGNLRGQIVLCRSAHDKYGINMGYLVRSSFPLMGRLPTNDKKIREQNYPLPGFCISSDIAPGRHQNEGKWDKWRLFLREGYK